MAKDENKPKPEAKAESKVKEPKWSSVKPNPKEEKLPEISDPGLAKKAKSISSLLSEQHQFDGPKIRIIKDRFVKHEA